MRLAVHALVGMPMVVFGALLQLGQSVPHLRAFGAALIVAGSILAWFGVSGKGVGAIGWSAVGGLAAAGLAASLFFVREDIGCMFCYHRGQGYPWGFVHTGFTHDDMPTVERAHELMAERPGIASRSFDAFGAALDAVFWASVALPLVTVVARVRAAFRHSSEVMAKAPTGSGTTPS
ncbi:hypothetical protein ACFFX1_02100 [Dactylosporangium sucinum]|uniref:Uncharacterized protein n=1 Tax=Dactylosporangium sucinum TaxID=1424081 RepID=A0A917WI70_9ACTN|nr:hypothetical protein [Dactylosporangium sucinum]GGM08261.1 hypothetical protein GCM10007977_006600 [Dactylosporangium sucinum]